MGPTLMSGLRAAVAVAVGGAECITAEFANADVKTSGVATEGASALVLFATTAKAARIVTRGEGNREGIANVGWRQLQMGTDTSIGRMVALLDILVGVMVQPRALAEVMDCCASI